MKKKIKTLIQSYPFIWNNYWSIKQQLRRIYLLKYFLSDISNTYSHMFWPSRYRKQNMLSAELLFHYHKLEKGLVMPGPQRLFGIEPAHATMAILKQWRNSQFSPSDPIYLGALQTLSAYLDRLTTRQLDASQSITPILQNFLDDFSERDASLSTPQRLPSLTQQKQDNSCTFAELVQARRSIRNFSPDLVSSDIIAQAVQIASMSPSACNRQPNRVVLVSDPDEKKALLAQQNGNRGFGHLAPHIAIMSVDQACFFDASERHQPYIDGGLFCMSFILALRSFNIGSCCLNWCVTPATDRAVHESFRIPTSERIIMLIAIGYDAPDCDVPRSPRRAISDIFKHH